MHHSYPNEFARIIHQIRKLQKRLQDALFGSAFSFQQHKTLQRRYQRCLQKLSALASPIVKTGAVAGSIAFLSFSASAQSSCREFHYADSSNPIKRASLPVQNVINPTFIDIDGDGDLDCYEEKYGDLSQFSTRPTKIIFLRNKGTKEVPYYVQDTASGFSNDLTLQFGIFPRGIDAPQFADMDGDGDYDCIIGTYLGQFSSPHIRYFENTGTAAKPQFTERTGADNPFGFVSGYYGLAYTLADLDNDGDYDLYTSRSYYTNYYRNVGTPQKANFQLAKTTGGIFAYHVIFYDWNKDGLLDEFQGNNYFKNVGSKKNPKFKFTPSEGPKFPDGFYLNEFVDINGDGYPDAFSDIGEFATASPKAYISAAKGNNKLEAYPKDSLLAYRWQRNGQTISGATTDHYTPRQPGLYTVQVTGACGIGVSNPYAYQTAQKTLSGETEESDLVVQNKIAALPVQASIQAYPNPFSTSFVVQLSNDVLLNKTIIRITDIQGRILQTIKPSSYTTNAGERLSKGLFFVQVITDKGVIYEQKLIKE